MLDSISLGLPIQIKNSAARKGAYYSLPTPENLAVLGNRITNENEFAISLFKRSRTRCPSGNERDTFDSEGLDSSARRNPNVANFNYFLNPLSELPRDPPRILFAWCNKGITLDHASREFQLYPGHGTRTPDASLSPNTNLNFKSSGY